MPLDPRQRGHLTQLVATDPIYRQHYIRWLVRVQHRRAPEKVLRAVPRDVAMELITGYEREKNRYLNQKSIRLAKR